jgi:hypothetical protein
MHETATRTLFENRLEISGAMFYDIQCLVNYITGPVIAVFDPNKWLLSVEFETRGEPFQKDWLEEMSRRHFGPNSVITLYAAWNEKNYLIDGFREGKEISTETGELIHEEGVLGAVGPSVITDHLRHFGNSHRLEVENF